MTGERQAGVVTPSEAPQVGRPIGRDHYVIDAAESRRQRFHRPERGLVAHVLRMCALLIVRWMPGLAGRRRVSNMKRHRRFARVVNGLGTQGYLAGQTYREVQIGKETRPVLILPPGATVEVPYTPQDSEDLVFGVAPVIEEHEWSDGTWGWEVACGDDARAPRMVTRVPTAGRDDNVVYFPGDGWIDVRLALDARAGKSSTIVLSNPKPDAESVPAFPLAISAPQVLRRRPSAERRCVLVLSIESLTDPIFLRKHHSGVAVPSLESFAREAVTYPVVYSTVDSTLPFAGSMFTGLLPSQHAIGNYAVGADTFDNRIISRQLPLLQETMKREQFVTFAAAGANRLSGKLGWTRGFDIFLHDFHKWSSDASVDFDCLPRTMEKFGAYDTFMFAHIDYLHEPLMCPGAAQGRAHLYSQEALSAAGDEASAAIFFEQLTVVDRRIGQLIQWLKDRGAYDNTGILITGDHGCGLNWIKHSAYSLYDERLRVPLIVKPPVWAAAERVPPAVASSIPEIFRNIHAWLGVPLDPSLAALPQYRSDTAGVAFAETIMNPNKDYRRHCIVIMRPPFKYACWNRINWETQEVEEFGDGRLFRTRDGGDEFDETSDRALDYPEVASDLRAQAHAVIRENLAFLRRFPPEAY